MKFYDLNSVISFGKFEGKTIREVADAQPSYLEWCSINLDHFFINQDIVEELKENNPSFSFSKEAQDRLAEKYEAWEIEQDDSTAYESYDEYDYDEYPDYERDTFDALTDGQYGDYDDWRDSGGDMDSLMDGLGF